MVFSFFRGNKPSLLQTGPGGQSRSHVLDRAEMSIGRAANADIVVDDPFLAPIHARIEKQSDGGFIIRRMGLNPIMLRGEALLQTASLKAGDSFRLGKDVEFQFVEKAPAKEAPKETAKAGDGRPKKPLFKQPAFLAGIGLVYLAVVGIVAYVILSGGGSTESGPTAERINAEAARIPTCIKNARRMRQVSEPSFNGAVGGRVGRDGDVTYAALSLATEPSDDAALAKAAEPIVEAYKRTALAALASEDRGNNTLAQSLYQQTYDLVPDVNCSAARFALQRRAATKPPARR
ncbi:FHA domain-containing protein [Rhizobium bangladeshense]|uniref:FHA domain-containing protein n=1 Tax=Rhizobium bangladeshense TaxID=1138189 RepID=UPI001C9290D9|nr:FHA domain-containing protein [Rhizobium bangladeshense]MBY3595346.1 FHA domain-containing protein [Rhizobium bangladeshense]